MSKANMLPQRQDCTGRKAALIYSDRPSTTNLWTQHRQLVVAATTISFPLCAQFGPSKPEHAVESSGSELQI